MAGGRITVVQAEHWWLAWGGEASKCTSIDKGQEVAGQSLASICVLAIPTSNWHDLCLR